MTDPLTDLIQFLDGDDGVWYDRFGLWTQGKRDTAWLAEKLVAAGFARADTAALDVDRLARVLAKAVCLDTEWRKTEEAMPPGWWFELYLAPHREGEVNPHTGIALGPQPGPYVASAQPLWSDGSQLVQVSGDSTAAALRALRAALEATDD